MKNNKKVIFTFFLALLMGIEALIANKIYFPELDIVSSGAFIVILNTCFWGVVFFLPKVIVWLFLLGQIILTIALLVYHNYFSAPLTLSILYYQFYEGVQFLNKAPGVFLNYKTIIVLALGTLNFYLYSKISSFSKGSSWFSLFFLIPLMVMGALVFQGGGGYSNTVFFKDICIHMGYRACWYYEWNVKKNYENILQEVFDASHRQPQSKVSLHPSDHIYIIQVESLIYNILNQKTQGKEITPFLNKMAKEGSLFEVVQKDHIASANTDFFVNAGGFSDREYAVIYNMYKPKDLYPNLITLAQKADAGGYYSRFYHNYKKTFFNRNQHIPAQGYKKITFYENLKNRYPKDSNWGVADRYLFENVLEDNKEHQHPKTLDFIITVSSHADFQVDDNNQPLLLNPNNTKDFYINVINYVDRSLAFLVEGAQDDALFIIYGDHGIEELNAKNVPLIIYSKKHKVNLEPKTISMPEMISIIHSLFPRLT